MKFFDYVNNQNGRVALKPIDQPKVEFDSPVAAWTLVLEHEKKVTGLINKLYTQRLMKKTMPPSLCSNGSSTSRSKKKRTPP